MVDFDVCRHDEKPCFMFVDNSGKRSCFLRNSKGEVIYVCVRVRFKGKNSVKDRGFGMTVLEKLERQGLISDE